MSRKNGFTLIELLVVIAIIAILAAIIFPVFMRAKEAAYRAGDMTNMNTIRNALTLYRADQEAYPPQILGYASVYTSGPQMGQLIPANDLRGALYPKRISSVDVMRPAFDRIGTRDLTSAEWPHADSRAIGQAPIKDLNGDGSIGGSADDPGQARQLWGPGNWYCAPQLLPSGSSCDNVFQSANGTMVQDGGKAAAFYKVSGYDVAEVKVAPLGQPNRWELHYTLRWSQYALTGGNRQDDPRQLIYSEPPDDTVITWDSWFRDYDANNVPQHVRKDFVLFLGGGARPYDSADLADRSWRVTP